MEVLGGEAWVGEEVELGGEAKMRFWAVGGAKRVEWGGVVIHT